MFLKTTNSISKGDVLLIHLFIFLWDVFSMKKCDKMELEVQKNNVVTRFCWHHEQVKWTKISVGAAIDLSGLNLNYSNHKCLIMMYK